MKILVIGCGYVGLVSGACFSEVGNQVTCIDIDPIKIEQLKQGILPIYEPGLSAMVLRNVGEGNLHFSTDLTSCIEDIDIVFIAVGTPMGEDGSADLQYVLSVAQSIGQCMQNRLIVVNKSTVPVGTAEQVRTIISQELQKRNLEIDFDVVSNPEFLKEGKAIADFMKPDRVVIGAERPESFEKMRQLYAPFFSQNERFITMSPRSAEMTKYAANAMLASRISFMNEVANICERLGANVNEVRLGVGSDKRIGYHFIFPGCGYGGSCFPKDVRALSKMAQDHHYEPQLINAIEAVNHRQKHIVADKVMQHYGEDLSGKTFAVWGLSFKPETDDMREAPSIYVIEKLMRQGAKIHAYDPQAMHEAKMYYLRHLPVSYFENKYEAIKDADALILLTEWKEFRAPDFDRIGSLLKEKIIFDGRNQYAVFSLEQKGFRYIQIGVTNSAI